MNAAIFAVFALNFIVIAALPRVFFRKGGRFNLMWWLTAAPLILSAIVVAANFVEVPFVTSYRFYTTYPYYDRGVVPIMEQSMEALSVVFAVASIALIALSTRSHRVPVSLWHQEDAGPQRLVTYGAYRLIRHPFYTSFLLTLVGTFLYVPHLGTLAALVYGFVVLNVTAAREERQLASQFGDEYRAYMQRTGRFWPRLPKRLKWVLLVLVVLAMIAGIVFGAILWYVLSHWSS